MLYLRAICKIVNNTVVRSVYCATGIRFGLNGLGSELDYRGLEFRAQQPIRIRYRQLLIGEYFADLVVDDKVIVEIKAVGQLRIEHTAQLLNYLKATKYEVGLLLNFGPQPGIRRHIFDNHRKGLLSWLDPQEASTYGSS